MDHLFSGRSVEYEHTGSSLSQLVIKYQEAVNKALYSTVKQVQVTSNSFPEF